MAVYRRGYQRYTGPPTSLPARLLVLPRFAWDRIFQMRIVTTIFTLSLFWPLLCCFFIYMSNHAELLGSVAAGMKRFLVIDGQFFQIFMGAQSGFTLILAAIAGPGLVAPDLVNNALPLYFSRPFTRADYILGRLMVLAAMLSMITILPGLLLFGLQAGMAPSGWLGSNWYLGVAMIAGFLLHILLLSLVALASSAYVKWRVVAGAVVLGFYFVLGGAAEIINTVFRVHWASVLNPGQAMTALWSAMLGVETPETAPDSAEAALCLLSMLGLLLWLLARKLRPVEVIR
jgi:ABC-2 type transport system permease protein